MREAYTQKMSGFRTVVGGDAETGQEAKAFTFSITFSTRCIGTR